MFEESERKRKRTSKTWSEKNRKHGNFGRPYLIFPTVGDRNNTICHIVKKQTQAFQTCGVETRQARLNFDASTYDRDLREVYKLS